MRFLLYRTIMASTILCQSMVFLCVLDAAGFAQTAPAGSVPAIGSDENTADGPTQVLLTEAKIQGLLAAETAIGAVVEKIPESQVDNPNPRIQARLDKIARQFGFKDYGDYDDNATTVSFILDGFDRKTKAFVGQEVLIKRQMAEIADDKEMAPQDRDAGLKELKDDLKSVEVVKYPDDVALVTQYYDKLSASFGDDE